MAHQWKETRTRRLPTFLGKLASITEISSESYRQYLRKNSGLRIGTTLAEICRSIFHRCGSTLAAKFFNCEPAQMASPNEKTIYKVVKQNCPPQTKFEDDGNKSSYDSRWTFSICGRKKGNLTGFIMKKYHPQEPKTCLKAYRYSKTDIERSLQQTAFPNRTT